IEPEEQLVLRFCEVINAARTYGIQNFLFVDLAVITEYLDVKVALRDLHAESPVTVNTHGSEVNKVNVDAGFDDRAQDIVSRVEIIVYGVPLVYRTLHRIR